MKDLEEALKLASAKLLATQAEVNRLTGASQEWEVPQSTSALATQPREEPADAGDLPRKSAGKVSPEKPGYSSIGSARSYRVKQGSGQIARAGFSDTCYHSAMECWLVEQRRAGFRAS